MGREGGEGWGGGGFIFMSLWSDVADADSTGFVGVWTAEEGVKWDSLSDLCQVSGRIDGKGCTKKFRFLLFFSSLCW